MKLFTNAIPVGPAVMSREEWLGYRRCGLGSSDAAAIAGLSPYKVPLEVFLDKVFCGKEEDSLRRRLGRITEDAVAQIYSEQTGRVIHPPPAMLLRHPEHSFMLASLDRATLVNDQPRVVEIKTTWGGSEEEWGEAGTDEVPTGYLIQVQHQLAVTGWQMADVICMFRGQDLGIYEVPRNELIIATLIQMESDFWQRVQTNQAPPLDYTHPMALKFVKRLFPGVNDRRVVELGAEAGDVAEEIVTLHEEIKSRQKQMDSLRARLIFEMQEAHVAQLPNGYTATRKVVSKKAYMVDAHSELHFKVRPPKHLSQKEAC